MYYTPLFTLNTTPYTTPYTTIDPRPRPGERRACAGHQDGGGYRGLPAY